MMTREMANAGTNRHGGPAADPERAVPQALFAGLSVEFITDDVQDRAGAWMRDRAMAFKIRVEPSGKQFEANRHENLLEAGLRSGLALPYSCSNGSCGQCRARRLEGPHPEQSFHDYVFSQVEKQQKVFLLCSSQAVGDMMIEVAAAPLAIPVQRLRAQIVRLERRGANCSLLELRTPRAQTLRFLAGQYVHVSHQESEAQPLAIASCPCNGRLLQFHLTDDDPLLAHLSRDSARSSVIDIEGPFGHFTLDETSSDPLVFIAVGAGFAPIKSLIEHAIALELTQPLQLYWIATGEAGHYLDNVCRAWRDALENFSYFPLIVSDDGIDAAVDVLRRSFPPASVYLSVPARLRERLGSAVRQLCAKHRLSLYPTGALRP